MSLTIENYNCAMLLIIKISSVTSLRTCIRTISSLLNALGFRFTIVHSVPVYPGCQSNWNTHTIWCSTSHAGIKRTSTPQPSSHSIEPLTKSSFEMQLRSYKNCSMPNLLYPYQSFLNRSRKSPVQSTLCIIVFFFVSALVFSTVCSILAHVPYQTKSQTSNLFTVFKGSVHSMSRKMQTLSKFPLEHSIYKHFKHCNS